jgi:hypothetical protein
VATLLKPYKFLFNSGKKKKRRKNYCTTKLPITRLTRVIEKTTKLHHIAENRLLGAPNLDVG